MTRLLFRLQWQQFRHTWLTKEKGRIAWVILGTLGSLLFLATITFALVVMATAFSPEQVRPGLSLVFLAGWLLLLLFVIPQVFRDLFSTRDVEWLFTLPIPVKSIFWVKYARSFFGTAGIIGVIFSIPLLFYGIAENATWFYYPLAIIVSWSLIVLGVSVAYLFNLGLVRVLPAGRTKELMVVMNGLAAFIIFFLFQLPNLLNMSDRMPTSALLIELPGWLPMTWASQAVVGAVLGRGGAWLSTGVLFLSAFLLAVLASTLVERSFRTGWIRVNEAGRKRKKGKKKSRRLRSPVTVFGLKEWRAIQRDIREWLMFLPMLFFLTVPVITLFSDVSGLEDVISSSLLSWLVMQGAFFFFFTLMGGTLAASSVGREGKAAWMPHVLPLSGRHIAYGKFWISWLLPLILVGGLEVIFGFIWSWSPLWVVLGILLYAFVSSGIAGIGVWMGTLGGKYNPEQPQNRLGFSIGLVQLL